MAWYDILRLNPAVNQFMTWQDAQADRNLYAQHSAQLEKDPAFQPDLMQYTNPERFGAALELKRNNLYRQLETQAVPIVGKFMNDYRNITGTSDERFMQDPEELAKAGLTIPDTSNPYVAKDIYKFMQKATPNDVAVNRYGYGVATMMDEPGFATAEAARRNAQTDEDKQKAVQYITAAGDLTGASRGHDAANKQHLGQIMPDLGLLAELAQQQGITDPNLVKTIYDEQVKATSAYTQPRSETIKAGNATSVEKYNINPFGNITDRRSVTSHAPAPKTYRDRLIQKVLDNGNIGVVNLDTGTVQDTGVKAKETGKSGFDLPKPGTVGASSASKTMTATNPTTGQQIMSNDGGKSWKPVN